MSRQRRTAWEIWRVRTKRDAPGNQTSDNAAWTAHPASVDWASVETRSGPSESPLEAETPPRVYRIGLRVAWIEGVTLFYVAAPVVIFVAGWLRPAIALALIPAICATVISSGIRAARDSSPAALDAEGTPGLRQLGGLAVLVAFLVACSGVGGLTFQFYDYWIYDALLKTLITHPWPVGVVVDYPAPDTKMAATYYWGFWLPAGLVGRFLGWFSAYYFQYFWTVLGVLLAVLWFMRIVGATKCRYALLLLFLGGIDALGYAVTAPLPDGENVSWLDYLTGAYWWSIGRGWMGHWSSTEALMTPEGMATSGGVFFRFFGLMSFLADGAHHVFPAALIVLVVLHDALRRRTVERLYLLTAFLPLHSVFATIGAAPLLAVATWRTRARGLWSWGNLLVGPALVLTFFLYYRSIESQLPGGPIWHFQDVSGNWRAFALYYVCTFGLYAAVAPSMRGNGYRPGRLWWWAVLAVFLAAPWHRMGVFSDFTTKAVIPMQIVFVVCIATALRDPEGRAANIRRAALAALVVLSAWSGLGVVLRALDFGFGLHAPPMTRVAHIAESFGLRPDAKFVFRPDSMFWRYLAKPLTHKRPPPNPAIRTIDFAREQGAPYQWTPFTPNHAMTEDGLRLTVNANMPLLRVFDLDLDARTAGSIEISHSVCDAVGGVPDYRLILNWVTADELPGLAGAVWPFPRWRVSVVHPPQSPRQPLSSNPYWRGDVRQIAIYFAVNDPPPEVEYTVLIRVIKFRER